MPAPDMEEMLERLIEAEDVEELRRLAERVEAHSEPVQQTGEMAARLEVRDVEGLGQALGIDPAVMTEGGQFLNLANRIAQAIRLAEFKRDRRDRPQLPTVVAEGDSWFLHPLITDTLDHLHEDHFNVRSMAAAGDTVENMLSGTDYVPVLRNLGARVFLFSGGGNDLLGNGRIAKVLHPNKDGHPVEDLVNQAAFGKLLARVLGTYQTMLDTLADNLPTVQVFAHGYDYLAKIESGPWIWPYLEKMGYTPDRAREAVAVLLDRFNADLAALASNNRNFTHVRTLNVVNLEGLNRGSWFDAIHPKAAGYGRVADTFAAAVRDFLAGREAPAFSEGVFGAGLGPSAGRFHRRPETEQRTNEEISSAYASRNRHDFEKVRDAVRNLPPKSAWLKFRDPLVHKHIEDVVYLLIDPTRGQTDEHVATRMRTRPSPMARQADVGGFAVAPEVQMDDLAGIEINLLEALFGESEIEPVQVLLRGYEASRAVGRVQVMNQHGTHIGHGSGFLVAPGLFLTNHHVLKDADSARRSFVIFDDEAHLDGSLSQQVRFRITGDLYWSSAESDYAFCSIEPVNRDGVTLRDYGFLPLIQDSGKALNFEPVSIIQHPGGDPKAIAIRNSFIMGRVDAGVYYTTDTLGGSSGSPVLNREWQVVALHHRFVPHPTRRGGVLANRGVRISHIYSDLFREQGRGNLQAGRILQLLMDSGSVHEDGAAVAAAPAQETLVETGSYSGLCRAELMAAIAAEDADTDLDVPVPPALEVAATEALSRDPGAILARLGPDGYRFIVAHEVSSRTYYERHLRNPILPGEASGVTIGIGYDLGYKTKAEFREDWGALLNPADLRELETCLGKTRRAAAVALPNVRHIVIPYDAAARVFERSSLPRVFGQLNRHFPDDAIDGLSGPCLTALMSLTFNRGPSFQKAGDRFREMREIRQAILGGAPARVPDLIRSMKRIWQGRPNVRGLLRRRDEEADLFESGLPIPQHTGTADDATGYWDPAPDGDEESSLDGMPAVLEAAHPAISASAVRWVSTYSNNPDYAHLPAAAEGARVRLDADLIETALRLSHSAPFFTADGHLIVAIRGAAIADGADRAQRQGHVELVEQKPDHRHFRCVIAVYHRDDRQVSAFLGSTVPNRGGVASCANLLNGHGGRHANLLPVGCYELCVGTHHGTSATVPTVLRLGTGPGPSDALRVTVLRTANDGVYGTQDLWDPCRPKDNIHPAFRSASAEFSSLGCLTVRGSYANGVHRGTWASFRETGGFAGTQHLGKRYNLLLTTGMELAALSMVGPGDISGLARLSHGSQGEAVKRLQTGLGIAADGVFGPGTKVELTRREAAASGSSATGNYTLRTETLLKFGVF